MNKMNKKDLQRLQTGVAGVVEEAGDVPGPRRVDGQPVRVGVPRRCSRRPRADSPPRTPAPPRVLRDEGAPRDVLLRPPGRPNRTAPS